MKLWLMWAGFVMVIATGSGLFDWGWKAAVRRLEKRASNHG